DLQPVLDVVAENAARLCEANDATINRIDGNTLQRLGSAKYGPMPRSAPTTLHRGNPSGRAVIDRTTVHVHDITAEFEREFPESKLLQERTGARTILCTPLLREGIPVGVITIRRTEVRPFSEKQIALLKIFADQAAIAIENVRLFQELKHRTGELETSNAQLREALEQQTATSEILGVIASSPTDIQPVLDVVAENAAKLCDATNAVIMRVVGDGFQRVAQFGETAEEVALLRSRPGRVEGSFSTARAISERKAIQIADAATERGPSSLAAQRGARTMLS